MIESKQELKDWLRYEKKFYNMNGMLRKLFYLFTANEKYILWKFQYRLRLTEYYKNTNKLIRYVFSLKKLNYYRNKYSLHIELNVFDRGLQIMHLGPILTNSRVKCGENCAIHINVAMVAKGISKEAPQIGSNVVIGVGSTLVGGVKISDGIAIGANSIVTKSFEEKDICIAGNPCRKINNNGREAWESA